MAGVDHLHELLAYLSANGCGTIGRTLYANAEPDETTGAALFVIEIGGGQPAFTYSTSTIRAPRFRVEARSTAPTGGDYPNITNARNLAGTAWTKLAALENQRLASTVSGSTGTWLMCLPQEDVYLAGRDARNRVVFAFSCQGERMAG